MEFNSETVYKLTLTSKQVDILAAMMRRIQDSNSGDKEQQEFVDELVTTLGY